MPTVGQSPAVLPGLLLYPSTGRPPLSASQEAVSNDVVGTAPFPTTTPVAAAVTPSGGNRYNGNSSISTVKKGSMQSPSQQSYQPQQRPAPWPLPPMRSSSFPPPSSSASSRSTSPVTLPRLVGPKRVQPSYVKPFMTAAIASSSAGVVPSTSPSSSAGVAPAGQRCSVEYRSASGASQRAESRAKSPDTAGTAPASQMAAMSLSAAVARSPRNSSSNGSVSREKDTGKNEVAAASRGRKPSLDSTSVAKSNAVSKVGAAAASASAVSTATASGDGSGPASSSYDSELRSKKDRRGSVRNSVDMSASGGALNPVRGDGDRSLDNAGALFSKSMDDGYDSERFISSSSTAFFGSGSLLRSASKRTRRGSSSRRPPTRDKDSSRPGPPSRRSSVNISVAVVQECSLSFDDASSARPLSRHASSLTQRQQAALQRTPSFISRQHTPPPNMLRQEVQLMRRRRRVHTALTEDEDGSGDEGEGENPYRESEHGTPANAAGASSTGGASGRRQGSRRGSADGSGGGSSPCLTIPTVLSQSALTLASTARPGASSGSTNLLSESATAKTTVMSLSGDLLSVDTDSLPSSMRKRDGILKVVENSVVPRGRSFSEQQPQQQGKAALSRPLSPSSAKGPTSGGEEALMRALRKPSAGGVKAPPNTTAVPSSYPTATLALTAKKAVGAASSSVAAPDSIPASLSPLADTVEHSPHGGLQVSRNARTAIGGMRPAASATASASDSEESSQLNVSYSVMEIKKKTVGRLRPGSGGARGAAAERSTPMPLPRSPQKIPSPRSVLMGTGKAPATGAGVVVRRDSPQNHESSPDSFTPLASVLPPPVANRPSDLMVGTTASMSLFRPLANGQASADKGSVHEEQSGQACAGSLTAATRTAISSGSFSNSDSNRVLCGSQNIGVGSSRGDASAKGSAASVADDCAKEAHATSAAPAEYLAYANKVIQSRRTSGGSDSSSSRSPTAHNIVALAAAADTAAATAVPAANVMKARLPAASPSPVASVSLSLTGAMTGSKAMQSPDESASATLRRQRQRQIQALYDEDDGDDLFSIGSARGAFSNAGSGNDINARNGGGATPRPVKMDPVAGQSITVSSPSAALCLSNSLGSQSECAATGKTKNAIITAVVRSVHKPDMHRDDEEGEEDEEDEEYDEGLLEGFHPEGFDKRRGSRLSSSITFYVSRDDDSVSSSDEVVDTAVVLQESNVGSQPRSSKPRPRITFAAYQPPKITTSTTTRENGGTAATTTTSVAANRDSAHARPLINMNGSRMPSPFDDYLSGLELSGTLERPSGSGSAAGHIPGSTTGCEQTAAAASAAREGRGGGVTRNGSHGKLSEALTHSDTPTSNGLYDLPRLSVSNRTRPSNGRESGSSTGSCGGGGSGFEFLLDPLLPLPPRQGILVGATEVLSAKAGGVVARGAAKPSSRYAPDPTRMHKPIANTFGTRGRRRRAGQADTHTSPAQRRTAAAAAAPAAGDDDDDYEGEEDCDYCYVSDEELEEDEEGYEWYWEEVEEDGDGDRQEYHDDDDDDDDDNDDDSCEDNGARSSEGIAYSNDFAGGALKEKKGAAPYAVR